MDADTIGQRVKRERKCQCPQCLEWFTSGKARYTHQRTAHGKVKKKPEVGPRPRIKPVRELYDAVPAV